MVITEFDGFQDFIAVYCKIDGKPEILVQDLNTKQIVPLNVTKDVGEILPMVNDDYKSDQLSFMFSSPFIY